MRRELATAAATCDYETLAAVAAASDGFSYSFGDEGDAGAYWRELEDEGGQPLHHLRALLDLPYATIASSTDRGEDLEIHVWPSAHGSDASDADFGLLVEHGLSAREQVEAWRTSGNYLGHRVGITSEGRWLFFVAGD